MICIDSCKYIDKSLYDEIWYPTYTCPNMHVGCIHKPNLGPSKNAIDYYYRTKDAAGLNAIYAQELDGKEGLLKSVVRYAEDKWIQMVCYEPNPEESDIYVLYLALRKYTDKIKLIKR